MPLTGAERAKRFRENLKKNPEKYEAYKKQQLERVKKCAKKISDLDENEKEKKRKQWREQKRNQKENKDKSNTNTKIQLIKETRKIAVNDRLKKKLKHVNNLLNKSQKNEERLTLVVGRLRKQLQRTKLVLQSQLNKNKELEAEGKKLKQAFQVTYKENCNTHEEKRLVKKVISNYTKITAKKLDGKTLGLKSRIRFSYKQLLLNTKVREDIEAFYLRDDITRCTAGKRECRTKGKNKMQIRYMVDTLQNLYEIYKGEGGKQSFSTFYRYKPFYVLSPNSRTRDTCMCIKHSNIGLILQSLKANGAVSYKNIEEVTNIFSCNTTSFDCMYGNCANCKTVHVYYDERKSGDQITWWKWVRIDHKYQKSGREITTKKTTKQEQQGIVNKLISEFETEIVKFKLHYYNWKEQQRQYRQCVNSLKDGEIVILCDFSENYECKYSKEIQATHFGASKNSITIHTGAIFFKDKFQTFATLSDSTCHEPDAIWAHLLPILKHAKEKYPINVIHFFSDGPTSQYRQKKNFYLLNLFTEKLKLKYSTWSFSESGHGKSVADGVGGSVKRQLDRKVAYGYDITNATDAYNVLQNVMKTTKCFFVHDNDIKNIGKLIPSNVTAVSGTMKLHQIISTQKNIIKHRLISCFCGDVAGLCDCHCPKSHILVPNVVTSDENLTSTNMNEVTSVISNIAEENVLGPINFSTAMKITSENNIFFDTPIICSIPSVMEDDIPLQEIVLKDLDFLMNDDPLLNQQNIIESTHVEDHIKNSSNTETYTSNTDIQTIDLTCPQKQCLQDIQSLPSTSYNKKRARILKPGEYPPSKRTLSNPMKGIDDKENKRRVKVRLPTTARNICCYECTICKKDSLNLKEMIKCMVCKTWVCLTCSGTDAFDYICPICLGSEE